MATFEEACEAYENGKSARLILRTYYKAEKITLPFWLIFISLIAPPFGWIFLWDLMDREMRPIFSVASENENPENDKSFLRWHETYVSYLRKTSYNTWELSGFTPDDWKERTDWVIE